MDEASDLRVEETAVTVGGLFSLKGYTVLYMLTLSVISCNCFLIEIFICMKETVAAEEP